MWRERPAILIGHGLTGVDASRFLDLGVPVLSSWQAKDLVDNHHPNYFGCPGIWGNRLANRILFEADQVIPIGNRTCVWNVGFNGLDGKEVVREDPDTLQPVNRSAWLEQCGIWRKEYPWVEPGTHDDLPGGIHPWRFTDALQRYFADDELIVTDMGTPLVAAHQVLRLKPPQRLMTSGGLGEMGVGLPAAIGASFSMGKKRVICLHADGGMMQNLQELQTIVHHRLPIKIIVYDNQCYGMIRQTQEGAGYQHAGIDRDTGMSTPDFEAIADGFGIPHDEIIDWADFDRVMDGLMEMPIPTLIVYRFPYVDLLPKLLPIRHPDGRIESPPFWDMSPQWEK